MECEAAFQVIRELLGYVFVLGAMQIIYRTMGSYKNVDKLNYQGFVKYVNLMRAEGIPISETIERNIKENKHLAEN